MDWVEIWAVVGTVIMIITSCKQENTKEGFITFLILFSLFAVPFGRVWRLW